MKKIKISVYFPSDMIDELRAEAKRVERSLNWIVDRCCRLNIDAIRNELKHDIDEGSCAESE